MEKKFNIEGMSCHHCVMAVETELTESNFGNNKVEIGSATVEFNSQEDEAKIVSAIEKAGFKVVN
jgi:copper chaperone CopZ